MITAFATIAAALSAICAVIAIRHNSRSMRLQVLESIQRDIRELDTDPPSEPRKLFNTIEYLAFVVNHELVSGAELSEFFKIGIVHWYEKVFPVYEPAAYADSGSFVEFRRAYLRIKHERPHGAGNWFEEKLAQLDIWASSTTDRHEIFERIARLESEFRDLQFQISQTKR
ncbi:MAG TPA: hypothetical protein VJN43_19550 [Bryobacteraceae bacterium]|nr:hypothetical protein [Bryobacteraceae bacterium]